jgi:hypothetical protein
LRFDGDRLRRGQLLPLLYGEFDQVEISIPST